MTETRYIVVPTPDGNCPCYHNKIGCRVVGGPQRCDGYLNVPPYNCPAQTLINVIDVTELVDIENNAEDRPDCPGHKPREYF